MTTKDRPRAELLAEMETLRLRLEEAEDTLRAIGSGEVDAFVVSGPDEDQVFTLRGADQPYRVLVETMNEGAANLEADGTILYCNNRLAAMLQVPLETLIGTQLGSYVAPADRPLFMARLGKCHQECDKDEIAMITGAGNSVPVLISCCALDLSGKGEVSLVVTDLTQQKRNEEIRAAELLASSIIEQAGEAIIVCDEEGKIIRASRLAHDLCGENLLLKTFNDLFKLRISETKSLFSVLTPLNDARLESVEVEYKRSDDQIYHLVLNAAPLKYTHNRVNGCVVTLTDITERKRAEEELRQSETRLQVANENLQAQSEELQTQSEELQTQSEELQTQSEELQTQNQELARLWEESKLAEATLRESESRFRALFENSLDAVFLTIPDGQILSANPAACVMFGMSEEEIIRVGRAGLSDPDDTRHAAALEKRRKTERLGAVELNYIRKNGQRFPAEVDSVILPGEPQRSFVILRDITERKRAEEGLKALNEELENRVAKRTAELREKDQVLLSQSRQAAMGEMIGNIAHQWRQPLNALGLTVQQLLLEYDLGEFTREFLDHNVASSMELIKHMSRTIDDFRNYFRPEKSMVEFKVAEAIANTLSLMEGSLQNPQIGVEIIAKDDPVIHGYRNEFAQVLLNILNNARDALTETEIDYPMVTITISSENGCAVVTVADNAGGVPEEIMGKIFDPYFTTKGPQKGTGVGLFMSKTIIENNMGGRLSVRNIANGAEFRIEVCHGIHV
jgi:PAS domain S-box-containing protein